MSSEKEKEFDLTQKTPPLSEDLLQIGQFTFDASDEPTHSTLKTKDFQWIKNEIERIQKEVQLQNTLRKLLKKYQTINATTITLEMSKLCHGIAFLSFHSIFKQFL